MTARRRIIIAVFIGCIAGIFSANMPKTVVFNNVQVGDIWYPILGLKNFLSGQSAYGKLFYNGDLPAVTYPFTAMMALYPFSFFPLHLIAPIFCAVISSIFAYALMFDGTLWRLWILLSVPFFSALHSVQFVPLMAAAILLPGLLPVSAIKPQLGIVLLAAGKWSRNTILATILFSASSLIIYPTWPLEWLKNGNLSHYDFYIPAFHGIGCILLLSCFKLREKNARMLFFLSLIPQRLWYDQLMLFLIPDTRRQLNILLVGSWFSLLFSLLNAGPGWTSGTQDSASWTYVITLQYFPALVIVYKKEIEFNAHKLRDYLVQHFQRTKNP